MNLTSQFPVLLSLAFAVTSLIFSPGEVYGKVSDGSLIYYPQVKFVEGDMPFNQTYNLQVVSPSGLPSGTYNVQLVCTLISYPAGTSDIVTPLSYVSLSQGTLQFTAPGQALTTDVTINIPPDIQAGVYGYKITTVGWGADVVLTDPGSLLYVTAIAPVLPKEPPVVTISVPLDGSIHTYNAGPGNPPLSIPFTVGATSSTDAVITALTADLTGPGMLGLDQPVTVTNLNTASASGTGSLQITAGGVYTLRAVANNSAGATAATVSFTVDVSAPGPTAAISSPLPDAVFTAGSPVEFSFSGTSAYGGAPVLSVQLDGSPMSVNTTTSGLTASGSFNLSSLDVGAHVFSVTATDLFGADTAAADFTVQAPGPTVTIQSPVANASFPSGDPIQFSFTGTSNYGRVAPDLSAILDNVPQVVSTTTDGLTATGTGTLTSVAPGSHTLVVTATDPYGTSTETTTFTVQSPPSSCTVTWLPPISLDKPFNGGAKVPIKFLLNCGCCDNSIDTSVNIAVFEIFRDGTTSTPQVFSYGRKPNGNFEISGDGQYHVNFPTAKGAHQYEIDVFAFPASNPTVPQLIDTKQFTTKGSVRQVSHFLRRLAGTGKVGDGGVEEVGARRHSTGVSPSQAPVLHLLD
ncbi:MAG: hypothetical protein PHQ04_12315 [Opitutaceae bacterium]|nr:hypothetical protein [Opitutaceae bacterium]